MLKTVKMSWCAVRVVVFVRNVLVWTWFWGLCLNQNHTFLHRMDFIFYELLEENSTASSWNMKSIRQRKVFVWEKTSPFWWNSFNSIYNRVSYRNSPNAVFDIGNLEKQQEKSGFPSRNQKYVVYLILNNLWRLVCTGQMVRGTNFISGSPPPILLTGALQRVLNSGTLTLAIGRIAKTNR